MFSSLIRPLILLFVVAAATAGRVQNNVLQPPVTTAHRDAPICYNGTATQVTDACNGKCCTGENACSWIGRRQVCEGSCNGREACYNFDGDAIARRSCNGDGACRDFLGTHIGEGSCNGEKACHSFSGHGIGNDSCNNHQACHGAIATNVKQIAGCNDSDSDCENRYFEGFVEGTGQEVTEACGGNCCVGKDACFWEGTKRVWFGSCMGMLSCYNFRGDEVGAESCTGRGSCRNFDGHVIGFQSCDGYAACMNMKANSVADNTCVGHQSCHKVDARSESLLDGFVGPFAWKHTEL